MIFQKIKIFKQNLKMYKTNYKSFSVDIVLEIYVHIA